jgi:hypothetical protein
MHKILEKEDGNLLHNVKFKIAGRSFLKTP